VVLLQVAKIQGVIDEIEKQRRAQMDKPFPERTLRRISFQDSCTDSIMQRLKQFIDKHVLVFKIAVDGPRSHAGPLGNRGNGGVMETMLGNQLQCCLQYFVTFFRSRHTGPLFRNEYSLREDMTLSRPGQDILQ